MALIHSPYAHAVHDGDLVLLYHALALKPLRGNQNVVRLLQSFRSPQDAEALVQVKPALGNVLKAVTDNQLLVAPGTDELGAWLETVLSFSRRRLPYQAVVRMSGLAAEALKEHFRTLDGVIAASDGPFSLVYRDIATPEDWKALVEFLQWAGDVYPRFDWLQHFVVTDGTGLTPDLVTSLRGYNLAFRVEGASDPGAVAKQLRSGHHRMLVSVPLTRQTVAADLAAIEAPTLYLNPDEELLKELSPEELSAHIQALRLQLKALSVSAYGGWDRVIFAYAKRRLPSQLFASLNISVDGVSVCGKVVAQATPEEVLELSGSLEPPTLPPSCHSCPVVGLCFGKIVTDGLKDPTAQCALVVVQWHRYLLDTWTRPAVTVATSAALG